jgi:hypothetical protein
VDDNFRNFETPPEGGAPSGGGGRRGMPPLNLQTIATGVLLVALAAILWIFFGPQPQPDVTGETATATPLAAGAATTTSSLPPDIGLTATAMAAQVAAGTPLAPIGAMTGTLGVMPVGGTPGPGTSVALPGLGTPLAGNALLTPVAGGPIAVGQFVVVGGTDGYGIRLRYSPGTDSATIRIVMDGETFKVMSGPEVSGTNWWRVQDASGNVGWASEEFLKPGTAPPSWAPPAASPTFEATTVP